MAATAASASAAVVTAGRPHALSTRGLPQATSVSCDYAGAGRRSSSSALADGVRAASTAALTAAAASGPLPPLPPFDPAEVEKPLTDYRRYRAARLPNNLQVLLVSDERCDQAAAALSVHVGSLLDPREVPGLAHFCEHMLFLGTDKYPKEDEYNEHLAKNGGASNAYTAETVTNYFFGVKPEALDSALDRFAQFFIAPLFTESATERELQAVDSEHSKNLQQDAWRQSQLLRSAVNPAHPLHHFTTGNSQTLRDDPAREGLDVRSALLDLHQRYYSANLMRLVIVGREAPEELLRMAQLHFSPVADRGASVPEDEDIGQGIQPFPPERLARLVRVVPVNDVRSATFQFVFPGQKRLWRSKPTDYISHLIGHEGNGSLLAALKRRGLATELTAGAALDEAGVHVFSVTIQLTEAGEDDVGAVGELFFAYARLLREAGPDERLWLELQALYDLGFKFRPLSDSVSTASGLAHSLQDHDPEVALSASARVWEYDPGQIRQLLDLLRCEQLRLVLASKAYVGTCDATERWYGTKYSDQPLQAELRARWDAAAGFPDLAPPPPNPFVPKDLELRPPAAGTHAAVPEPLPLGTIGTASTARTSVVTSFFRKDEEFKLPTAACAFILYCPYILESIENRMLTELWCLSVQEELNEFAYEAQVAGLSYVLQATSSGMILSFGGYNDKLATLLEAVARKMAGLAEVCEQTYGITRTILERDLVNAATRSPPYQQGFAVEGCLLQQPAHSFQQRLEALRGAGRREALAGVNRRLLDRCHVECLLQGNLTAPEARSLVRSFLEPLGVLSSLAEIPPAGTAALPLGWTLLEREGTNPEERNGAVIVTLQAAEHSLEAKCLAELAGQVLGQRFFDELRTKQQLGYIVSASAYGEEYGFVGLRLIVQSERPAFEVLARVRAWAEEAWGFLTEDLTEAEFEEYRAALISQLRERPKSLNEEFGWNWAEVASRAFAFGRRAGEAKFLEGLALQDLRRFAAERLRGAPAACIVVRPAGGAADSSGSASAAPDVDRRWTEEDVAAFRRSAKWHMRNAEIRREVPQSSALPARL